METVHESYWTLADKADKKFVRLRDLPPYGGSKWDVYFHKAFQVYTKLWKYQQENRQALVEAGLKRWEIGEIASRIGQLSYTYYLRTSDATFLSEAYIFYEAIMTREYFKDTGKDAALANKHLRFHVRFIVVCLLLNRREMAQSLTRQLRMLVDDYRRTFQGNDSKEWKRVVQEISRFLKADSPFQNSRPLRYSVRLDQKPTLFPPVAGLGGGKPLKLKDAVLASYYHNEVKFAELTLDTFRVVQCLEWEPSGSFYRPRVMESNGTAPGHSGPVRVDDILDQGLPPNPHKYILHRLGIPQLLLVLATACEELPADGVIFLYLSASGKAVQGISAPISASSSAHSGSDVSLAYVPQSSDTPSLVDDHGRTDQEASEAHESSPIGSPLNSPRDNATSTGDAVFESPCSQQVGLWLGSRGSTGLSYLYPTDILPFTRRPLFIVIDSDNSSMFELIHGQEKGEPAAVLLSPIRQPSVEHGFSLDSSSSHHRSGGSFFTFFLTAPFLAFCQLVNIPVSSLAQALCEQGEKLFTSLIAEWGKILSMSANLDPVWARIMWDPFLRRLLLRFIFCRACLALHTQYGRMQEYLPRCLPSLPKEVLPSEEAVEACIFRVASSLQVVEQFRISSNIVGIEKEVSHLNLEDQRSI